MSFAQCKAVSRRSPVKRPPRARPGGSAERSSPVVQVLSSSSPIFSAPWPPAQRRGSSGGVRPLHGGLHGDFSYFY